MSRHHHLLLTAFLLAVSYSGVAHGQAYQCRAGDARLSTPPAKADAPARRTPIKGYTLALSWSPEFCRTQATHLAQRRQCSGDHGRFGFILHGLWPEGSGDSWPQWCRVAPAPPPATLKRHFCMTPSPSLMARQWAKHGTCMAQRSEQYFHIGAILWNSLVWPDYDRISREKAITAGTIRQAFITANPAWRANQIGVRLNSRGWLEEIRLCYGADFMPARCTPSRLGAPDKVTARIWRGL